jgi:hypothetical protein
LGMQRMLYHDKAEAGPSLGRDRSSSLSVTGRDDTEP